APEKTFRKAEKRAPTRLWRMKESGDAIWCLARNLAKSQMRVTPVIKARTNGSRLSILATSSSMPA
ncbi:MAG: hypothetical protein ACJ8LL_11955, partial [Candidatus Udaeobacter sp.]